eukprot:COSAG01_NODE_12951_length_1658_cov_1.750481_3_plen_190_part_00
MLAFKRSGTCCTGLRPLPKRQLFLHCSWRVLSIDAAFEYKGRSDKNYIILEGITVDSTIFPLAFGFCFGESERTYNLFWDDVLDYSDTLKSAIDNVNTRINADRHPGIQNSIAAKLQHEAKILHNGSVHLKRNVRTALQAAGCMFATEQVGHNADRLLDELMAYVRTGTGCRITDKDNFRTWLVCTQSW